MKKGFTLIEALIYILMLAVLLVAVVQILLNSTLSMSGAGAERKLFYTAESSMETLIRDIRQASEVLAASSSFNSNPGTLALRTVSTPGSSTVVNRTFSLSSGRLQKNDGGANEFLTPPEIKITDLTFWHNGTTTSSLITIRMILESGDPRNLKTHTFYGSAVLRAKY